MEFRDHPLQLLEVVHEEVDLVELVVVVEVAVHQVVVLSNLSHVLAQLFGEDVDGEPV